MFLRREMLTWTFRRSIWWLIGLTRFVDTEPCNSILLRGMVKNIKRTSRTVGAPPITISTTWDKSSPFSIAFSASKSESSISKPLPSFGITVLPPARFAQPVLIWLPPWAPCYTQSPNLCYPETAVMENILSLWTKTSEYALTIRKTQCTVR